MKMARCTMRSWGFGCGPSLAVQAAGLGREIIGAEAFQHMYEDEVGVA